MEDFITRHEHEEYVKRMEQEHKGMNARIKDLETEVKEITDLTISINNLALRRRNRRNRGNSLNPSKQKTVSGGEVSQAM